MFPLLQCSQCQSVQFSSAIYSGHSNPEANEYALHSQYNKITKTMQYYESEYDNDNNDNFINKRSKRA